MQEGAKQAVDVCLKIGKNDKVVITTDVKTMDIGASLMDQAKERTKNVSFHIMEDYGQRPITKMPSEIAGALSDATVSILAITSHKGELDTFRQPYISMITEKNIRHAHMVGITNEIMEQGMSADYNKIKAFSKNIFDLVNGIKTAKVTTKKGTNLSVEFAGAPWIISDGHITKENWSNLPDGEVWTVCKNCNGRLVVDGVLGDFFSTKYGLLEQHPLVIDLKDGRVERVQCDNDELLDDFNEYIKTDENSNRIGEFALGTNLALTGLIGNLLQDEKFPGVHVAFGHPYPKRTGADWDSCVHCDAVIMKPSVVIDGKKLMKDGKYLI